MAAQFKWVLPKNESRCRCLIQVDVANFQNFIFSTDTDVAKYIKFNAGTVGQVDSRIIIGGIAVRIPGMSTDTTENAYPISQRKTDMGAGLNRLTVEIQILVLELAEIHEGALKGQIAVEPIACKNLITGVFIAQLGFVGLYVAYASSKVQTFVISERLERQQRKQRNEAKVSK
jgi:hypothetical protein